MGYLASVVIVSLSKPCVGFPATTKIFLFLPSICTEELPNQQILVPRMSQGRPPPTSPGRPLKILFDHPGDVPNWRPGDVLIWHPGNVLKWSPGAVLIWRIRDVPKRLIRDVPRTSPRLPWKNILGMMGLICWMSLNFFLHFLRNLFDSPNLSKRNSILKVYLEPSQTSKMDHFLRS